MRHVLVSGVKVIVGHFSPLTSFPPASSPDAASSLLVDASLSYLNNGRTVPLLHALCVGSGRLELSTYSFGARQLLRRGPSGRGQRPRPSSRLFFLRTGLRTGSLSFYTS